METHHARGLPDTRPVRWPWQTREDRVVHMLDALLAQSQASRDEIEQARKQAEAALDRLEQVTKGAADD